MDKIEKLLFEHQDEKYKVFNMSLLPTLDKSSAIGVRMPWLRNIAKRLEKDDAFSSFEKQEFLRELPHRYFEENMLHAIFLSSEKDFGKAIEDIEQFLPYVDNWAVCDTFSPKCFANNKSALWAHIEKWLDSNCTYVVRFGIVNAMRHFLDEDFSISKFERVIFTMSNEYYVNMAIAWYVSVALSKHYAEALPYIEGKVMPTWVHNKSIQKACESFRVAEGNKTYLKTLKIHD